MRQEIQLKQQAFGKRVFGLSAFANVWVWAMALALLIFAVLDLVFYTPGTSAITLLAAALTAAGLCCGAVVRGIDRAALVLSLIFLFAVSLFVVADAGLSIYSTMAPAQDTLANMGGIDMGGMDAALMEPYPMDMGAVMPGMMGNLPGAAPTFLSVLPRIAAGAACLVISLILAVSFLRNRVFFLLSEKQLAAVRAKIDADEY